MPRTVLGWRCRWGPGHSLPTSYTSPRATNKPLIVFPIHTDRGHHCLSGFTPCLSRGPWFTPFENYLYSSGSFTQFVVPRTQHGRMVMSARKTFFIFLSKCCTYTSWPIIDLFKIYWFLLYSIPVKSKNIFLQNLQTMWKLTSCDRPGLLYYSIYYFFSTSSYKNIRSSSHLQLFVSLQISSAGGLWLAFKRALPGA